MGVKDEEKGERRRRRRTKKEKKRGRKRGRGTLTLSTRSRHSALSTHSMSAQSMPSLQVSSVHIAMHNQYICGAMHYQFTTNTSVVQCTTNLQPIHLWCNTLPIYNQYICGAMHYQFTTNTSVVQCTTNLQPIHLWCNALPIYICGAMHYQFTTNTSVVQCTTNCTTNISQVLVCPSIIHTGPPNTPLDVYKAPMYGIAHQYLKLDSTKVQTLGAISESININETRHCTAADTGPRSVYLSTEPVSRRLAASAGKPDCTSAFPRCAGQLVAKAK